MLLFAVHSGVTTRWSGQRFSSGISHIQRIVMAQYHPAHVVLAAVPGALIQRFFLTPDYFFEVLVGCNHFTELSLGERIELLQPD